MGYSKMSVFCVIFISDMHVCINVKCIAYSRSQFLFKVSFGKRNVNRCTAQSAHCSFLGSWPCSSWQSTLSPLAQRGLRNEAFWLDSLVLIFPDPLMRYGCQPDFSAKFDTLGGKGYSTLWWVSSRSGTRIRLFMDSLQTGKREGWAMAVLLRSVSSCSFIDGAKNKREDFNCGGRIRLT